MGDCWGYADGLKNLDVDLVGTTDSLTGDVTFMFMLVVVIVIVIVVVVVFVLLLLLSAWRIGGRE